MKNLMSLIAMAVLFVMPAVASAGDYYGAVNFGTNMNSVTSKLQTLDTFGVEVGRKDVLTNTDMVVNYTYVDTAQHNAVSGNELTLGLNYKIATWKAFTPYVGASVGYGNYNGTKQDDGVLLGVNYGLTYNINQIDLTLGGRYVYAPNTYIGVNNNVERNDLTVGVRYNF